MQPQGEDNVRAFTVHVGDEALEELRRRIEATRWIEDAAQGAPGYGTPLSMVQDLCRHWLERFDWRALEERINRVPQVLADIDGLQIHAVHCRSSRPDAIPLLLIHGWPSSFLEFIDLCEMLAEPGDEGPAFHLVIPSLPGYGYSTTRPGTSPDRIAALLAELMTQLGHERFIVQGGNWGSAIGTQIARRWPGRVIGLHLNTINGSPPPPEAGIALSAADQAVADGYARVLSFPHFNLVSQAPLSIAHALNDSPAGQLGWIADKLHDWADTSLPGNPGLSPDWIVANAALYWLTGTAGSSAMLYREAVGDPVRERFVAVPTAVAHFAREQVVIPRPWAERHYAIARWTRYPHGGHYPAIEVPEPFARDIREFAAMLSPAGKAG